MRAGRAASKARLAKPREPGDDPAGPSPNAFAPLGWSATNGVRGVQP